MIQNSKQHLITEIEKGKEQLYEAFLMNKSLIHHKVLMKSQELDRLIACYQIAYSK